MDVVVFALGGALLAALVRGWQPAPSWRAAGAYLLLAGGFFGGALLTPALQVASDVAYARSPWSETRPPPERPRNELLSDVPMMMVPFRALVRERLLRGRAPLWAHELSSGQPLLGNGQSAAFAPLHLLASPLPPVRALTVTAAWQMLLALLLTHALLRSLGAGPAGAALAAVGYGLSSFLVVWAYYPMGMAAAWLPGVLLGIVSLHRRQRHALPALVTCGAGAALAGHPESLLQTALAAALLAAALLVTTREARGSFAARLGFAALLVGLLTAPGLLPFVEAAPESQRGVLLASLGGAAPLREWHGVELRVLVDPLAFGSPRDDNWWWTPANYSELCTAWIGLAALTVALAGGLAGGRGRGWALAGVVALAVAFGWPPLAAVVHHLPLLRLLQLPRLRLLAVLALAVAAGLALERLPAERRGRWLATGALLVAAVLGTLYPPQRALWQRLWWVAAVPGCAVAAATLLVPRARRAFPAVIVSLTLLDLLLLGVRFNPLVPGDEDLGAPPAVARLLAARRGAPPFRVAAVGPALLPNLAALYGLADARVYDPMAPWAPQEVLARAWQSPREGFLTLLQPGAVVAAGGGGEPPAQPALDYLGVRYLLADRALPLPAPWRPVWQRGSDRLWENRAALPLFFAPRRVEVVASQSLAIAHAAANRDFAALAVVERPLAAAPGREAEVGGGVVLRRIDANGFRLEVESPGGCLVASSVSHARGWRVDIDGEPVPALRVNGGFLGFVAPPGRHRVRLDYRPAGWRWGLALAAAGVLLSLLAIERTRRAARPAGGPLSAAAPR
ncbi:MAG TPA: YfhO family protein [Thermoanaerobaculia bacterium]|jgi:hypothetical protein|nr:YfhO family protein [Thermoanaerobaculia bacterium]